MGEVGAVPDATLIDGLAVVAAAMSSQAAGAVVPIPTFPLAFINKPEFAERPLSQVVPDTSSVVIGAVVPMPRFPPEFNVRKVDVPLVSPLPIDNMSSSSPAA